MSEEPYEFDFVEAETKISENKMNAPVDANGQVIQSYLQDQMRKTKLFTSHDKSTKTENSVDNQKKLNVGRLTRPQYYDTIDGTFQKRDDAAYRPYLLSQNNRLTVPNNTEVQTSKDYDPETRARFIRIRKDAMEKQSQIAVGSKSQTGGDLIERGNLFAKITPKARLLTNRRTGETIMLRDDHSTYYVKVPGVTLARGYSNGEEFRQMPRQIDTFVNPDNVLTIRDQAQGRITITNDSVVHAARGDTFLDAKQVQYYTVKTPSSEVTANIRNDITQGRYIDPSTVRFETFADNTTRDMANTSRIPEQHTRQRAEPRLFDKVMTSLARLVGKKQNTRQYLAGPEGYSDARPTEVSMQAMQKNNVHIREQYLDPTEQELINGHTRIAERSAIGQTGLDVYNTKKQAAGRTAAPVTDVSRSEFSVSILSNRKNVVPKNS